MKAASAAKKKRGMFPSRRGGGKILLIIGILGLFTTPLSSLVIALSSSASIDRSGVVGAMLFPVIFISAGLALMYSRDKITTIGIFIPAISLFFSADLGYPLSMMLIILGLFAGAIVAKRKKIGTNFR